MMKKFPLRLAAAMLALAPISLTEAQTAGKDLAMDFRTSTSVEGGPDSSVLTGHSVASANKVRIDMAATGGRSPTPLPTDGPVSMIVSDGGRTIAYLDTKNSKYMIFRQADIARAQAMTGVKMEYSGSEAKVDNLGAGPTMQGRPTSHYRVTMGTTMTLTGLVIQPQPVKIASKTEYYFPTDIKSSFNAFASITGSDMLSMLGSGSKELSDKMKAVGDKLPKTTPLRTSTTTTVTTQGVTRVTRSNTQVTSVQWVNADSKVFEIPAGYTLVELPGMGGPPPAP